MAPPQILTLKLGWFHLVKEIIPKLPANLRPRHGQDGQRILSYEGGVTDFHGPGRV